MSFLEIQAATGWGRVLQSFASWCQPQDGWYTLDIGCGPGLLPNLLAQAGCHAFGIDLDFQAFTPQPLHDRLTVANALHLPFPANHFHLATASNVLFLLEDPLPVLRETRRVLREDGILAVLNPSENMSMEAVNALADQRNLQGLARESLINWAARAESHHRWTITETESLFGEAGLKVTHTQLKVGPGLARFVSGIRQ